MRTVSYAFTLLLCLQMFAAAGAQEQPPAAPALQPADLGRVSIPLPAMGREYLMSASMIPQELAATSTGLRGRVVVFELYDDSVDLYESTKGLVVTEDLPARRLLTSFPIVARDEQKVTIDFNAGMRRVFTTDWTSSGPFNPVQLSQVLQVPQARVFSVEEKDGMLTVRQAVQARSRESMQDLEQRMEIRYFFRPYQPGDFEGRENPAVNRRYVQYFESPAQLELSTGRSVTKAARFDISKPVVFYYSTNTPDEYVEAVRAGVLYWNRAFDKEVVRCERAPEGVTAPNMSHNVIQWVPWDSAGFAYADVLLDPRTGQSLHGQAYMTSVFAISGVQRARLLLRRLRSMEEKEDKKDEDKDDDGDDDDDDDDDDDRTQLSGVLGLPFFQHAPSCQCDVTKFAHHYANGLLAMLEDGKADDAAMLRASQDYVLAVVCHEVGHVLGLRHNFAGSLAATLSPKELDDWFDKYLTEEKPPEAKDQQVTSSIMEYSQFPAEVFIAWKIRTDESFIMPHDRAAIRWGYYGEETAREQKLLFATDGDVRTYGDVTVFDYGADPIIGALAEMGKAINSLPTELVERFVSAKAPRDPRDAIPLEKVSLDAGFQVSMLMSEYRAAFRWFAADTRSLKVENAFEYIGPLNEEERLKAHWDYVKKQVEMAGGIDRLGFGFLPLPLTLKMQDAQGAVPPMKFEAEKMVEKVGKLLESEAYQSFVGADGKTYEFTAEERELIKSRAKLFFADYEKELVLRIMQRWAAMPRDLGVKVDGQASDEDIVADLEKQIIAAVKHVVMARKKSEDEGALIQGKVDKALVAVVDFQYDLETRLAAARTLANGAGSFEAWSQDERKKIGEELKAAVEASLNINNFKDFKDSTLSRRLRDWYLEQQQVIRALQ